MTDKRLCPKCGAELSADAAQGLCPKCLLDAGLESEAGVAQPGRLSRPVRRRPRPFLHRPGSRLPIWKRSPGNSRSSIASSTSAREEWESSTRRGSGI